MADIQILNGYLLYAFRCVALMLLLLCAAQLEAQTGNQSVSKENISTVTDTTDLASNNDLTRKKRLTGSWGGARNKLWKSGIAILPTFVNFYQGMVQGEGNNNFEFGSKFALTTVFHGERLGLWKGFFTIARMEYNMGQSVNNRGGTAFPVNAALAYPGIEGADRWDMNIYFIQFLSETDKIVFGKINNLDLGNFSSFSGGLGIRHFMNNAFVGPPNGISVPYVFGAYYMSGNSKRDLTFAVYDANSRVNKLGFEDLFQDGVTFFASANLNTNFFEKKGKYGIVGVASTKEVPNFNDLATFFPPGGNTISEKSHRWSLGYFFEQTLFVNPNDSSQSFGVFGQIGLTDGEGSYADYYWQLGVSGDNPLIKSRRADRWGIGFAYVSFPKGLDGFTIPAVPDVFQGLVVNSNESIFEAYYEAQLTPWISLGINFQYIIPGVTEAFGNRNDNVSFLGFRSQIKL